MNPPLEFLLEGKLYAVYFHHPGGRHDPHSFYQNNLSEKERISLLATFRGYAETGQVPGRASGHKESWYHFDPPSWAPPIELFKFKDDPRIRFYAVIHEADGENRVVITYGFQDPKKGRQRDKNSETGRATRKAEEITLTYIDYLRPQ